MSDCDCKFYVMEKCLYLAMLKLVYGIYEYE